MMNNTGILVQIIGAVVDADFSQAETLPALLNALEVDYEVDGRRKTLVLEVQPCYHRRRRGPRRGHEFYGRSAAGDAGARHGAPY